MHACVTLLAACVCLASYGQADMPTAPTDTTLGVSSGATTLVPSSMAPPSEAKTSSSTTMPVVTSDGSVTASTSRPGPTAAPASDFDPTTGATGEVEKGFWSLTDDENNTCILLQAGIQLSFKLQNSTGHENVSVIVSVPKNGSRAIGDCKIVAQTQSIGIAFFDDWLLELKFKMNATTKYDLHTVSLKYNTSTKFSWAESIQTTVNLTPDKFETDDKKRYECMVNQTIYEAKGVIGLVGIYTNSLKFEAFRVNDTSKEFDANGVTRCSDDEVSQLVPIIVGAALGGLIIIVLIAYLIGRKRSRRGYESV
jgi:lysosomal-associated membrane protein 1/2